MIQNRSRGVGKGKGKCKGNINLPKGQEARGKSFEKLRAL